MPFGWRLEAEYSSGYVLTEDEADHSPYDPGRNVFHAILNGRATAAGHGPLVRFSLIGLETRYDVDWTGLPANARPVYFRDMRRAFAIEGGWQPAECVAHHFGVQYTDGEGRSVKEVHEIPGG